MSFYFLKPVDVWLFRDGRPFDVGMGNRAQSLFPPYPTVVQGAIRSHQLVLQNINLNDKERILSTVGSTEDYLDLRLRGPFLAYKDGSKTEIFYPLPADAVTVDLKKGLVKPASVPVAPPTDILTSRGDLWIMGLEDKPVKGGGNFWLKQDQLVRYLKRETVETVQEKDLFTREIRTGISIDENTRITVKGALFEVEYIRPEKGIGLLMDLQGYSWPETGLLRLGGESRAATFEKVADAAINLPVKDIPDANLPARFKVCFVTPTWFTQGWKPENWNTFFTGQVMLRSAAISRYQSIGGFDFSKKWHKPSRRFVPAGSVFYFESSGPSQIKSNLVQNALTEWGAEIGFGQYILEKEW